MKEVTIPNDVTPSNTMHSVDTVAGTFRDVDGYVVLRFEHPPGVTVSVPDAVDSVEVFPGRGKIPDHPIADKYHD